MTVLIESGHVAEYPYNHARILWNNVITAMSATGAATGNPASAALTKTTYERWKPTASGDTLTGTFDAQQINAVAIAAHSDLTPTVEVLQDGAWVPIVAFPFEGESLDAGFAEQDYRLISYAPDNEAILLLIKPRICSGVRVTVTYSGTAPTLGVLMAGKVLEMQRPFYSGHNPALLSSQSTVRPNISESGEWLGASQIRQGRNVAMSWENLKAPWVRKNFMPFSEALLTNPFVAAWNPKRFPDAVYCSSSERPQPSNSGTLNYQNISLNARAYSDGTTPEVLALATSTFNELFTFTRNSAATEVGPSGQLREVAADVARFTHDPVTLEPLGLLIEEERTNIVGTSDESGFGAFSDTITDVAENPPLWLSAIVNQVRRVETASIEYASQDVTVNSAGVHVFSGWVKPISGSVGFRNSGILIGSGNALVDDAGNVSVTGSFTSGEAIPYPDGWYLLNAYLDYTSSGGNTVFWGCAGEGLFATLDIQKGEYPTSYIKTEGAQVTRQTDLCERVLGPEYRNSEGAIFLELGQISNPIGYIFDLKGGDNLRVRRADNSFALLSDSIGNEDIGVSSIEKIAVSWNGSSILVATDGGIRLNMSYSILPDAEDLQLGQINGGQIANAVFKKFRIYPRALTATELEDLTS